MDALQSIVSQFTPGAAGVWTGVAMFAAYILREWRETRKLSYEDRMARREGYARQVQELSDENRALRNDQRLLREEYDHYRRICQAENDQLRTEMQMQGNRISGMMRKLADIAVHAAQGNIDAKLVASILQLASEGQAESGKD